jgi:hypothetical protein
MLAVLDAYSEVLTPTRTYQRRSFVWIPADPDYPEADGRLGNLSIKVQPSARKLGAKVECDTYFVERDTPEPGDELGAAFWLINMTDPQQEAPYRCIIGGLKPKCGCKAGQCKVPADEGATLGCKHQDALAYLIENGILTV